MPSTQIDGIRLSYDDAGEKSAPVVVLLHGFPFTSQLWHPQIEALSSRYRIITPDLRGFGRTELGSTPYTMARLADDVAALLDALEIDPCRGAVIGGLSMGGYVAFELYRRHAGSVAALLLADTRPHPDSEEARANRMKMAQLARTEGSPAVADQLIPKLLAAATRENHPEIERGLREMMGSVRPEAIEAALTAMAERADSRPLLPDIEVPTLVVTGAEDRISPPSESAEWARLIPRVRFETIHGAGHVPNLEQAEEFNAVLIDFLTDLAT